MDYKILLIVALVALLVPHSVGAQTPGGPSSGPSPLISCNQLFTSSGIGHGNNPGANGVNPYVPQLASLTGYGSIVSISLLIILMMFMVIGATYAIGFAFHIETLLTFAKTEILEGIANVVIIVVVGVAIAWSFGAINFFANFASITTNSSIASLNSSAGTQGVYIELCNNIQSNIMLKGLENWFGIFTNLYITNFLAHGSPPLGGFTLHLMPNGFGLAFSPFHGMALATQLIWDEQLAYFSTIFLGMFMIIMLFIIYFLFPLFLYVGIALRSFPWTRPAGGSLIALFISFYIIFPALLFPFTVSNSFMDSGAGSGYGTPGFCSNPQFSSFSNLCSTQSFLFVSWKDFANLLTFSLGDLFYSDIYSFMEGMEYVGLSVIGLIIAVLISYEMVEKIGSLLGAPSLQGSRVLSRIL